MDKKREKNQSQKKEGKALKRASIKSVKGKSSRRAGEVVSLNSSRNSKEVRINFFFVKKGIEL